MKKKLVTGAKYHKQVIVFLLLLFSIIFLSCNGDGGKNHETSSKPTNSKLLNISVYDDTGKYADSLVTCAKANKSTESCSLNTLPLIGLEASDISVQKIMQRTVVSHHWMGDRFKQLLEAMPADTLQLFNSVSMVIIDSGIRPSFYWTMTAAIYVDPAYLWLTNQEKSNIAKNPDYRSDYGKSLALIPVARYVKNNHRAYQRYSLNDDKERSFDDIKIAFFRLIFHELAHANDFAPPDSLYKLDNTSSVFDALNEISDNRISNLLYQDYPLHSTELVDMGQVLFGGKTATTEQRQMTPSYAGKLMGNDFATHIYSYFTKNEDLAMLFEAASMKKYFAIDVDIGFTNKPDKVNPVCADYIVGWGSRNRLANSAVQIRAKLVVQHILSNAASWDGFFDDKINGVGKETLLQTGVDWCSILDSTVKSFNVSTKNYIPDTIYYNLSGPTDFRWLTLKNGVVY